MEEFCPKNKNEWREWLNKNHVVKDAVWLIFYRKKSIKYNLSWSESVDEALCYGWIDSTKKTIDSESYKQYFTKRKTTSNWSKVNKEKIEVLTTKGLMTKAGYDSVKVAKLNGSWNFLDKIEALIIPSDLKSELLKLNGAMEFYNQLSNSKKKILLYWVASAKRNETRMKRIKDIAQHAENNLLPKQFM